MEVTRKESKSSGSGTESAIAVLPKGVNWSPSERKDIREKSCFRKDSKWFKDFVRLDEGVNGEIF